MNCVTVLPKTVLCPLLFWLKTINKSKIIKLADLNHFLWLVI